MPRWGFDKVAFATLLKANFGMGVPFLVNLLHFLNTPLYKNTYGELLLDLEAGGGSRLEIRSIQSYLLLTV